MPRSARLKTGQGCPSCRSQRAESLRYKGRSLRRVRRGRGARLETHVGALAVVLDPLAERAAGGAGREVCAEGADRPGRALRLDGFAELAGDAVVGDGRVRHVARLELLV